MGSFEGIESMAFDTLKLSRQLSAAGMDGAQADKLAEILGDMMNEQIDNQSVSRAEFQLLLDQLALLREQVSLLRGQAAPAPTRAETLMEPGAPQDLRFSASLLSRKGLLHALAVLVGVLAAHTTFLAWLFDLF